MKATRSRADTAQQAPRHRGKSSGLSRLGTILVVSFLLALATYGSACPLCDTENGREVRAGIFGDDFAATFFGVLAPFPVLVLLIVMLHRGRSGFGCHSKRPQTDS